MPFPPSAACRFFDLPPVNLQNLPLHLTKNSFASAPTHLCGIALTFPAAADTIHGGRPLCGTTCQAASAMNFKGRCVSWTITVEAAAMDRRCRTQGLPMKTPERTLSRFAFFDVRLCGVSPLLSFARAVPVIDGLPFLRSGVRYFFAPFPYLNEWKGRDFPCRTTWMSWFA